MYFPDFPPDPT